LETLDDTVTEKSEEMITLLDPLVGSSP